MAVTFIRPRSRAGAALLGALALVTGCDLTTESAGPVFTPAFAARVVEPPASASELSNISILGHTRRIEAIGGILVMPCLTANYSAQLQRNDTQYTVRLVTSPSNAACESGPAVGRPYNFYLTNMTSGTYTVRVVHDGDQLVPPGTAVKEVTVVVTP